MSVKFFKLTFLRQICLCHVLRSFWREVSSEKVGITAAEIHGFRNCCYAATEAEYLELYQPNKAEISYIKYYNTNWQERVGEWPKNQCLNRINNHVESINQKLKGVISKFSHVPQFVQ